jgi:exopolyphosphatase/guanosine-5'-triphosphate,3'-diphosphate pyrophosphatase
MASSQAPLSEPPFPASGERRVAAIDIGTNSIHLLIAAINPAVHSFSVVVAEKSTTRLGERDPNNGDLSAAAIERAFLTLRHCRDLAASHGVEQIVTAATSAVSEAPNRRKIVLALQDQLVVASLPPLCFQQVVQLEICNCHCRLLVPTCLPHGS